jgi:hypothetical protein
MAVPGRSAAVAMLAAAMLAPGACAAPGSSTDVPYQATGSSYFSLSRPGAYKVQGGLELTGRVCRRARTTLLSPSRVRIEHIAATGDVVEAAHAGVPVIYGQANAACANYGVRVNWKMADGEAFRACFDRGRSCRADPAAKAAAAPAAAKGP